MKPRTLSIEEKLRILDLAQELGSIAEACRVAGISRPTYYAIKRVYERDGRAGLTPKPRRKPKMPNAFAEEIVHRILELSSRFPSYSSRRIAHRLGRDGLVVSDSGVRKIWQRHGLKARSGKSPLASSELVLKKK